MKTLFFTVSILFSTFLFSQRSSDLTLHISTFEDTKLALEYRIPIKDKWGINFALTYGSKYNRYTSIFDASDTLFTERHTSYSTSSGTYRIGTDKRIKESMFSVGFDFLLGYRQQNINKSNTEYTKDSLDNWGGMIYYNFGANDPTHAQITKHYIVPGLQVNAKMDIPIKYNFELALAIGYNVNTPILIKETNIIDPYNELAQPKFQVVNANAYASIGLRYKFMKKGKA